jgi:dTDP-glucose 4,6-dehydratase
MKNVLVTGGCGFIGSNFVRYLRKTRPNFKIVVLDKLTYAGNFKNLVDVFDDASCIFAQGDVANREMVKYLVQTHEIEAIVHLAAETHVDRSIVGADAFIQSNVHGTQVLLDIAKDNKLSRFLLVSTDEVYGSLGPTGHFTEKTSLAPSNPYSASKAGADLLTLAYHKTFGLNVVITRCSNNYGPYQFPEKLIPLMIINAMQDKPLPVYGDGKNIRDWLHVEDHADALLHVLERGEAGEIYNIGGGTERPNIDIVRNVLSLVNKPTSLIEFVTDRPGHDRRYSTDASKIRSQLGWSPKHDYDRGLAETVAWYGQNRAWWQDVLQGTYRDWYQLQYASRLAPRQG